MYSQGQNKNEKPANAYNHNAPALKKGSAKNKFAYAHSAPQLKSGSAEKARTYKKNAPATSPTGSGFGSFIGIE